MYFSLRKIRPLSSEISQDGCQSPCDITLDRWGAVDRNFSCSVELVVMVCQDSVMPFIRRYVQLYTGDVKDLAFLSSGCEGSELNGGH
jgi:hypothetical protein